PLTHRTDQPRYDVSPPKIDLQRGPNNQPVPGYRPPEFERSWVGMYHGANQLYTKGVKNFQAVPFQTGHRTWTRAQKNQHDRAMAVLGQAKRQYNAFDTHFKGIAGKKSPYTGIDKWRLRQVGAATNIGQGNTSIILERGQYGSHKWRDALDLYGAVERPTGRGTPGRSGLDPDKPVPVKTRNLDDRRLLAQAHNNHATMLYRRSEDVAREYLAKVHTPGLTKAGWLDLSRAELLKKFKGKYFTKYGVWEPKKGHEKIAAEFKRWYFSTQARGLREFLNRTYRALDNFRAALFYQPENDLYFDNLYRALQTINRHFNSVFYPKRYRACARLLAEMKRAGQDRAARAAVVKKLLASNDCLGPALGSSALAETKPPPPKKPKVKCRRRGLVGGVDCVGKRIEGR
ncbi:MAG: hypothetical protein KKC37_06210, partial [Proteobacteria bacterium]|nr:hypothetical protein [Pseudomonadota bacterium]